MLIMERAQTLAFHLHFSKSEQVSGSNLRCIMHVKKYYQLKPSMHHHHQILGHWAISIQSFLTLTWNINGHTVGYQVCYQPHCSVMINGIPGHQVGFVCLIFRIVQTWDSPLTNHFLAYVQCLDIVSQINAEFMGLRHVRGPYPEAATLMYILKHAI